MARKSVTKSKPVTKIRKYQTGSIYQQVANPYYISGTYAEQAKLEAKKAIEAATKFGDYSQARAIEDEVRKKERARQEEQAVNETNQQIAAQNSQELQQTATESLTSGLDLLKKYRNSRDAIKAANAAKEVGLIANTAMQAGTAGTWAPIAATPTAAAVGLGGTQVASFAAPTAATATTAGTSLLPGAVEVGSQVGSQVGNASSALGTGASIGTGLATAGVGLGLNLLGTAIEKGGDDNDFRTFDRKQATTNVLGEMTKTAGMGASIGGIFGLPGALIGGAGGLVAGGVIGLIQNQKNKKIAKEYQEEQDRINKENEEYERKRQAAIRQQEQLMAASAQKGFTGSRLQGLNTGFGYNTSTNMNTQPTSSFYGKTGGAKVPGGKIVPIEGSDAVEFVGRKHSEGGIMIDPRTEVEGGETMDQVMMAKSGGKGNKNDYFFSAYLKLGGKSFAQRHKEILKSGGSQANIQQLAKMQEAVANKKGEKDRSPANIAKYGGIHKYQTGSEKEEDLMLGPELEIEEPAVKGGTSFEDAQKIMDAVEAGAIKEGTYNTAEQTAQNKAAVAAATSDEGVPADQIVYREGKTYLTPGITGVAGHARRDATKSSEEDPTDRGYYAQRFYTNRNLHTPIEVQALLKGFNPYQEGTKEYDDFEIKLAERNNYTNGITGVKPTQNPDASANTQNKTTAAASETKPSATPEQSANAQSNADASNVTVRDQNKANAEAPKDQTTVAPGGTTNNAGQASADAAANAASNTNNTTATTTSTSGTPTTGTPPKERVFGKEDITKGAKGVSKSMEKVPEDQGDQGTYFGNVSNAQFDAFKANNPWFDFSAGFDPKKRDYTSSKGIRGSSDVARFQEEYNKNVGTGNKLQVDGKLGEQTATAMLMFTDPEAPAADQTPTKKEEVTPEKTKAEEEKETMIAETRKGVNGSLLAGLGQLIPVGYAMFNKYKTDGNLPRMKGAGNVGAGSVRGAILPRVNMNAERAAAMANTVAINNAIQNTNAGPGGIAAMMAANTAQNTQMLKIANQEQEANKQLVAEEARLGQQASQFNVQTGLEAGKVNVANRLAVDRSNLEAGIQEARLKIDEKRYKREEILGALDTGAARTANIVKDEKYYRAQERLADALDETGSYNRRTIYENLKKESKRKDSPYYGMSDERLKKIAANTVNQTMFGKKEEKEDKNTQKMGGTRKYTSRLGQLSKGRKTFNI
jgi:hypothetical protein